MFPTLRVNIARVERTVGRFAISSLVNLGGYRFRWIQKPGSNGLWLETDRPDAQVLADMLIELGAPRRAVEVKAQA